MIPTQDCKDKAVELCPAGRIFQVEQVSNNKHVLAACDSLQSTCKEILKTTRELENYAISDKARIEALEQANICKGRKIEELRQQTQNREVQFAQHLGEHEAAKEVGAASGKKWGILSGGGGFALLEALRWIFFNK